MGLVDKYLERKDFRKDSNYWVYDESHFSIFIKSTVVRGLQPAYIIAIFDIDTVKNDGRALQNEIVFTQEFTPLRDEWDRFFYDALIFSKAIEKANTLYKTYILNKTM